MEGAAPLGGSDRHGRQRGAIDRAEEEEERRRLRLIPPGPVRHRQRRTRLVQRPRRRSRAAARPPGPGRPQTAPTPPRPATAPAVVRRGVPPRGPSTRLVTKTGGATAWTKPAPIRSGPRISCACLCLGAVLLSEVALPLPTLRLL